MNFEDFPSLDGADKRQKPVAPKVVVPYTPLTAMNLNLETELLEQYNRARRLLHDAEYDSDVPLNQKAQALNSATAIIGALIKSQADLYSLERIKKIETVLLDTLRAFPELQEMFMRQYTEAFK